MNLKIKELIFLTSYTVHTYPYTLFKRRRNHQQKSHEHGEEGPEKHGAHFNYHHDHGDHDHDHDMLPKKPASAAVMSMLGLN